MKRKHQQFGFVIVVVLIAGCWLVPRLRAGAVDSESPATEGASAAGETLTLEVDADGGRVFHVSRDVQRRVGLRTEPLIEAEYQPNVIAYGRTIEDPGAVFTLRSPVAGYLRRANDGAWPGVGEVVTPRAVIGAVHPRLTTIERLDLNARLMQARANVDEFSARLVAAKSSYEHKKSLNNSEKLVTDRAIEAALANVKGEAARLAAAEQSVQMLSDLLSDSGQVNSEWPLVSEGAGVITDVYAHAGEVVEPGQALLKVLDTRRQMASVSVPTGAILAAPPTEATIEIMGLDSRVFPAKVRTAAQIDPTAPSGQRFLVSFDAGDAPIRPGLLVRATLALPGRSIQGVVVPRAAVVRMAGSAYVYLQTADERFARTLIDTVIPLEGGWFVSDDLAAGRRVVTVGAGTLLSEELRSQIDAEAEGDA